MKKVWVGERVSYGGRYGSEREGAMGGKERQS